MAEGRQTVRLAEARPPFFVGVDLGGTNIKLGIVDDQGETLGYTSIPTQVAEGPEQAVARIAGAIEQLIDQCQAPLAAVQRIGLGSPGPMDVPRGLLLTPGNLPGWWQFPLRDRLRTASGRSVTFANDANAAAFGEYWIGSAQNWQSLVFYTLGTGVGGGIIVDDNLVEGHTSSGAELGHMIIDYSDNARSCSCGQRGHIEAYASATALVVRAREALAEGRPSTLRKRDQNQDLTAVAIHEEAEQGDALALELVDDTARYLGIAIVSAIHAIDPEGVLLGGAMTFGRHDSAVGRRFLAGVKIEVCSRALPQLAERTLIDYASLGGDAGYLGAAALARRDYYNPPAHESTAASN